MVWIILIAGFAIIIYCLVLLAAPKLVRRMIDFFSVGSRLYAAGLIRLLLGVMLLLCSAQSKCWGFVIAMGLLASAGGISVFFLALRRTKKLLTRLRNQSDLALRLFVLVGLIIWAALVCCFLPAALPSFPR